MMKNTKLSTGLVCAILTLINLPTFGQAFTAAEYQKAHWMTTRFYGAQRSGENNWFLYDHKPDGVPENLRGLAFIEDQDTDGYDVSGGWHDAGDHVKFGQTQYYAAYMLIKGYDEFKTGYDDYYSHDYAGYKASGDWTWEGGDGAPNGIPDILDEVKHATDFFIKCTRNSTTFYYQVGDGGPDHKLWMTAVQMQTESVSNGGQQRSVYKNPNGASMASFCGATLAAMSRLYEPFDPDYAALCLQHALYAYDYAKAHPGTAIPGDGAVFYGANDNWKDDYLDMCAELYWATGDESYRTEALSFSLSVSPGQGADVYGKGYGFDYSNNGDIAVYNQAKLGNTAAIQVMEDIVNTHYFGNTQGDGQFSGGNVSWGPLRYNANTALMVALWQKLKGTEGTPNQYIFDNIDYILGDNNANQSFLVGFGTNSPDFPHHRNHFLRDDNPGDAAKRQMVIPVKNRQSGLMVGGTRNPGMFSDDLVNFQHTEGGVDYNACLVGVLGYLNSLYSPVDTTKFFNVVPDLGEDKSLCGSGSVVLDANVPTDGVKTFRWLREGNQVQAASTSAKTFTATQAGEYTVELDSLGEWMTSSSVFVSDALPAVDFGPDIELCDPTSVVLRTGVEGSGINYAWSWNGGTLDETGDTLWVRTGGNYAVEISATGCVSQMASITIGSLLPEVNDGNVCNGQPTTLSVNDLSGDYSWYETQEGGISLTDAPSFQTNVPGTYYVQDNSSFALTSGPVFGSSGFQDQNSNNGSAKESHLNFEVLTNLTINSVKFEVHSWGESTVDVTIKDDQGNALSGFPVTATVPAGNNGSNVEVMAELNVTLAPGNYSIESTKISNWFDAGSDFYPHNYDDLLLFQGPRDDMLSWKPNNFGGYFDWEITAGTACARVPVLANDNCITSSVAQSAQSLEIFPNPFEDHMRLELPTEGLFIISLANLAGQEVWSSETTERDIIIASQLTPGIYYLTVKGEQGIWSQKVIKR